MARVIGTPFCSVVNHPKIIKLNFIKGQQTCNTNFGYDVDQTRQSGVIPILEITRQPSSRPHRFRYRSEMHGTHGCELSLVIGN